MKIFEIVEIYTQREFLNQLILPFKDMRRLKMILNDLSKEIEIVLEEEQKLIEKYTRKDDKGNSLIINGNYVFENLEKQKLFEKGLSDIQNTDVDLEIEKIDLVTNDLKLSIEQADILNLIFNFV